MMRESQRESVLLAYDDDKISKKETDLLFDFGNQFPMVGLSWMAETLQLLEPLQKKISGKNKKNK